MVTITIPHLADNIQAIFLNPKKFNREVLAFFGSFSFARSMGQWSNKDDDKA
jgi:hypothetical protein